MSVAGQVGKRLLGSAERRLAVDHPRLAIQRVEVGQVGSGQLTGLDDRFERSQHLAPKQLLEHAYRDEEARPASHPPVAVDGQAAAASRIAWNLFWGGAGHLSRRLARPAFHLVQALATLVTPKGENDAGQTSGFSSACRHAPAVESNLRRRSPDA